MVPFLENVKQGCKLEREELLFRCKSHACQPPNSPLSVLITTQAADKQPNQNDSSKNTTILNKGKGVQNKHHLVYKYLIQTFLLEGTF